MESIARKDGHSKLSNIKYTQLKMQEYLKDRNNRLEDALNIFKYRTHMADFGSNFRAGADIVFCPHEDTQSKSFECQMIKNNIDVAGSMDEVYNGKVTRRTIQTINEITRLRREWNEME